MQFSGNNLLMTDNFFLRIIQFKMFGFKFAFILSRARVIITGIMLFLQLILYWSSFVGTRDPRSCPGTMLVENEAVLPDILKFKTKHKDNPFALNCSIVLALFCLYFMQACVD